MRRALWSNVSQYTAPQPTSPQFLHDLDHAVELKMKGARLDCVPGDTANGKDLREVIAKAEAAHARGLLVLLMTPHWLASKAQVPSWSTLSAFAKLVMASPLAQLAVWIEMGNEPGSPPFTGNQKPDPVFQANVTKAFMDGGFGAWGGHLATPGLAPVSGSGYVEIGTFIDGYWGALDQSHRDRINGAGVHIYSPPVKTNSAYFKSWGQLDHLHAVTGKKLQVTEFNILGATGTSRAVQFRSGLDAFAARPDVGNVFLYEMTDQGGGDAGYGAYTPAGSPTPLVPVLQSWAAGE